MALDRIDRVPNIRSSRLDELLPLPLPNGHELALRAFFYRSIVPVLYSPSGTFLGRKPDGTVGVFEDVRVVGTAFCIHPSGVFLTAAHVPPPGSVQEGKLGFFIVFDSGVGDVFTFRATSADPDNDVALLATPTIPPFGFHPFLPLATDSCDLSDKLFVTLGYPATTSTPETLGLNPTAYAGEETAVRVHEQRNPTHMGQWRLELDGDFVLVDMSSLPGMSGAPLCMFDKGETTYFTKAESRRTGKSEATRVERGKVVGILSWNERNPPDRPPGFSIAHFADIAAALRLPMPRPENRSLRDLLAALPPRSDGP